MSKQTVPSPSQNALAEAMGAKTPCPCDYDTKSTTFAKAPDFRSPGARIPTTTPAPDLAKAIKEKR